MLLNQTQVVWILAFRFLSALNQRWRALPSDALYIPHGVRSLSRRDPLPNVAIAAMPDGLPLLCFDKASGIAERIEKTGLSEACVAAYLDTAGIAERVLNLICAPETYARIRAETKTYAADMFGFARYVTRIGQIALSACSAADSSESAAVKSIAGVSR